MSGHSVRLRFVGWLHRVFYPRRQIIPQGLREYEVQSQSGTDANFGNIRTVNNRLGQRQVDNAAIHHAGLCDQARHHGSNAVFLHDPVYIAYAKRLAASNHNFISHQKSPIGIVFDVSSFNQKMDGVQFATSHEKVA